jgi:ornithine cyclodeaminase/alanine dehydrogenase-like protein (mu-crystallin family)
VQGSHARQPTLPPQHGNETLTLLLTRSDIAALVDADTLVEQLRVGFVAYSASPAGRALRVRSPLPGGKGTATVLFPGTHPGLPAYTVKIHAKSPDQVPAIRGVLCLHDTGSGELLAVMDSTYLTAIRTGIGGALAANVLARPDADTVAVVGAGVQGSFQLRALARMRRLRWVSVYDIDQDRAAAFARSMTHELSLPVGVAPDVTAVLRDAGVVLIATWAIAPFVLPGMLEPGAHVTTLGADEPGKAEVAADVIRASTFVCDDRTLAVELGALRGVNLGAEAIAAELGEVLAGSHPGRTSLEQITVYGAVGLAFQDAIAAWHVYEQALAAGAGQELDYLA